MFFEHCFQIFEFFNPVAFLRQYARGTLKPDLLHAVCAIAARYSNHPAVTKSPPSASGQIYVDRIKARMFDLISAVSLDTIHILILTAFSEYYAGHLAQGYRLEGMAGRIAPELGIHRLQGPKKPFESEAARIDFEIKIRTFTHLVVNGTVSSLLSGLPEVFDTLSFTVPIPVNNPGWWIERMVLEGQPMEPLDEFSLSILHKIMNPTRFSRAAISPESIRLVSVGRSAGSYCNAAPVQNKELPLNNAGKESKDQEPLTSAATPTDPASEDLRQQNFLDGYRIFEAELAHWRATIPEEWEPSKAKFANTHTSKNVISTAVYYYVFVIFLNRPLLLKACLSIIKRKGNRGGSKTAHKGTSMKSVAQLHRSDNDSAKEQDDEEFQLIQTCLQKCIAAADEIVAIVEQFTDDEIIYRGSPFCFPIFIAGTVYIFERIMGKEQRRSGIVEERLAACHHFLRVISPYWAGAIDQERLLARLGSFETPKGGTDASPSPAMELLTDFMMYSPSTDGDELEFLNIDVLKNDKEEWLNCPSTPLATERNAPVDPIIDPKVSPSTSRKTGEREVVAGTDPAVLENAFLTTDSGLGTMWGRPDKMDALEEATLLSFEKLSMIAK
ncbi:hypothetical protein BGX23_000257 [Mortierella sp. AD031]|nr:hypothetical protein BGX23_000257 [Mortierella sp. AD031]